MSNASPKRLLPTANKFKIAVKTLCKLLQNAGAFNNAGLPNQEYIDTGYFSITCTEYKTNGNGRFVTRPCAQINEKGFELVSQLVAEYKNRRNKKHIIKNSEEENNADWKQFNTLWNQHNAAQ